MKLTNKQFLMLLGVAGLGLWYAKKKAGDVVKAIDPTSTENIAYKSINSIGGALSGSDDFSLGAWVYDVTHDE